MVRVAQRVALSVSHKAAPRRLWGGFEQRLLACQEKGWSLTIKSFYVSCMNCRGLFTWLCVCKVLLAYGPPCHILKPSMFASGLDRPRLGPAGWQTEPGGCGVKVCAWEPRWRLLPLGLEKRGCFLHPDIKKATWPESPGDLWPGTRWSPFDPSASGAVFTWQPSAAPWTTVIDLRAELLSYRYNRKPEHWSERCWATLRSI